MLRRYWPSFFLFALGVVCLMTQFPRGGTTEVQPGDAGATHTVGVCLVLLSIWYTVAVTRGRRK